MITKSYSLPTEEELTVEEINLSTPALKAGAFHLGKYCEFQNDEFMLCSFEEQDPRKCINEGKAVTSCALEFFRKVKKSCHKEFDQFANCLDKGSHDMTYRHCRNTQAVFDNCMLDKLEIEKPHFGYYCRPKIHDSLRPKPKQFEVEYPNRPEPIPDGPSRSAARYGSRYYWLG